MTQFTDTSRSNTSRFAALPQAAPRSNFDGWGSAAERLQMWQFTVENANDPVIITSTELKRPGPQIVYVNRAFTRISGYAAHEVIGLSPRILQGPQTDHAEMNRMRLELEAGRPFVGETINYTKAGQPYHMEWSVYGLHDENGVLVHYVAVQRDISARKNYESQIEEQARQLTQANAQLAQANARLATLSLTDSLTGIGNHRAFHLKLDEEIERATRYQTPLSLLLLDVDEFKSFNDTFGHPAGDGALQQIAQVLGQHARSSDLVARHGGEEFAVVLPQTDRDGALALAENLRAAIENAPWPWRAVTVSIGAATLDTLSALDSFSTAHPTLKTTCDLTNRADEALYTSKKRGRNCVS